MATVTKYGNQTPTHSLVLPYTSTKGAAAIKSYQAAGRKAQPWQIQLIYDILAVRKDKLYVHTKVGYSVPRRNGKGEVLTMRELYGLDAGEKILHTAHRTTTSSDAALRLATLLKDKGYTEVQRVKKGETYEKAYTYSKQFGLERITLLDTGGRVDFRTRTAKGGLGEGFDVLIIDEAQEYTDDQQSSLQYVVSDSKNPQIILCGTPPTTVSGGTVFPKLREECLFGDTADTMWAEWSVDEMSDCYDKELWYQCNPAMGYQLNERKVSAEDKTDKIDFNIQRLGLWIKYNQKSAITEAEWSETRLEVIPKLSGKLFVGIKYGNDGVNVAMSVAVKMADERTFVEAIDCRPARAGNDWIINFLRSAKSVAAVVVDGANGQAILEKEMRDAKLKKPVLPAVKEIIVANSLFEQAIEGRTICHMSQPSLVQSVTNCGKRSIGTNGGFGYKSIKEDTDISLMDSVILAHWLLVTHKEAKGQRACC